MKMVAVTVEAMQDTVDYKTGIRYSKGSRFEIERTEEELSTGILMGLFKVVDDDEDEDT